MSFLRLPHEVLVRHLVSCFTYAELAELFLLCKGWQQLALAGFRGRDPWWMIRYERASAMRCGDVRSLPDWRHGNRYHMVDDERIATMYERLHECCFVDGYRVHRVTSRDMPGHTISRLDETVVIFRFGDQLWYRVRSEGPDAVPCIWFSDDVYAIHAERSHYNFNHRFLIAKALGLSRRKVIALCDEYDRITAQ